MKRFLLLLMIAFQFTGFSQEQQRGLDKVVAENDNHINTFAIIIGISDYREVADLHYADRDASAFADFLMSATGGVVDPEHIKLFINEDATAVNIGCALEEIGPILKKGDRLIIFFAGHGDIETASKTNGLLLLYKAPKSSYWSFSDDYLSIQDLMSISQVLAKKEVEVIIIADACRSGKLAGGNVGRFNTLSALNESWGSEIKILSCQPNELSFEGAQWGGGHGLFSFYLIYGLYGLADKDNNGQVTLLEIDGYLKDNVAKDAAPAFQTPVAVGDLRKIITTFDADEFTTIKTKKEWDMPIMAVINSKGLLEEVINSSDTITTSIFEKYSFAIDSGNLILPPDMSAKYYYEILMNRLDDENAKNILKRNFAASLQDKAMEIIVPILKLEKFKKKNTEEYNLAAMEIGKAIDLLGDAHYLVSSLKVRKLFIEAYALCEEFELRYSGNVIQDTTYLHLAEIKLHEAIEIGTNAAYPYFQLGWIYLMQNKNFKALEVYSKYMEMVPNNKRAHNNLGIAYEAIGKPEQAIICYEKALALDSTFVRAYDNIGYIYAMNNEFANAAAMFRKTVQIDTTYLSGYYNLGVANIQLSLFDDARECFRKMLELDPENFDAYYNLAAICAKEGNVDQSLDYLKTAFEHGYDNFEWLNNDPDFEAVRSTKSFKNLIKKYSDK